MVSTLKTMDARIDDYVRAHKRHEFEKILDELREYGSVLTSELVEPARLMHLDGSGGTPLTADEAIVKWAGRAKFLRRCKGAGKGGSQAAREVQETADTIEAMLEDFLKAPKNCDHCSLSLSITLDDRPMEFISLK